MSQSLAIKLSLEGRLGSGWLFFGRPSRPVRWSESGRCTADALRCSAELLALGVIYLLVGVLGFVPGVTVPSSAPGQGLLLGVFAVNTVHNIAHLALGAALVWAATTGQSVRMVNRGLAVVFAILVVGSVIAPIVEGRSHQSARHRPAPGEPAADRLLGFLKLRVRHQPALA